VTGIANYFVRTGDSKVLKITYYSWVNGNKKLLNEECMIYCINLRLLPELPRKLRLRKFL